MSNQNPSEVHGPIGASNHRSHTSRLIVSLSPTQPALWFPSVVYALSFPAAPFPRGTVPTRARCRAERTGRDGTSRSARAPLRAAPPGRQQVPDVAWLPALRGEQSQRGMPITPHLVMFFGAAPARFPGWKAGPAAPPQPLTSVSMGSTSIPFHSSSKWAIGMLGDSRGRDQAAGTRVGRRRERRQRGVRDGTRSPAAPGRSRHPLGKMAPRPGELRSAGQDEAAAAAPHRRESPRPVPSLPAPGLALEPG